MLIPHAVAMAERSNIIRSLFLVAGAAQKPAIGNRRLASESAGKDVINFSLALFEH
jgi:hypothetical protein